MRLWIVTALGITALATFFRLILNLRHNLSPGVDGAYYPLQTRWLIEHGELAFDAPPLVFWIQSTLAQLLQSLLGMNLDDACLLASRLVDCLLPPWAALPIVMLGYRWSLGRPGRLIGCASAAVLATISPPVMRMASDFQKNSVGLVWMAFAIWALCEALAKKNSRLRWAIVALFLFLAAMTHAGAFGLTCVILCSTLISYCVLDESMKPRKHILMLAAFVASGTALILATSWIAPDWAQQIIDLPTRAMSLIDFRMSLISLALSLAVYWFLGIFLRQVWFARQDIDSSDVAVAIGCSVGIAVLMLPVLQATWSMRFQLMTPIPGAILLAFSVARLSSSHTEWRVKWLTTATALLALAAPLFMQGPAIAIAAADELKLMRDHIDIPSETLVVAPHGFEFWAGMILHTQASRVIPDKLESYRSVMLIKPKEHSVRPMPPAIRDHRHRGPPQHHGPPRHHPSRREDEMTIPADAQLIHEGTYFRLFEID